MSEYITHLHDQQRRAEEAAKAIVERAHTERRATLTGEEEAAFQAATRDRDRYASELRAVAEHDENKRHADIARAAYEGFIQPTNGGDSPGGPRNERDALNAWFRGDDSVANVRTPAGKPAFQIDLRSAAREATAIRAGAEGAELRSILGDGGSSGGSLVVPTVWERSIYQYLEAPSAIRRLSTVFQSDAKTWTLPKVATHGIGTQVIAQGTAIGGTDPVLSTMTLDAFKYGQFVQVSTEMIADSAFDIVQFVTGNVARAVGRVVAADYAVGTGTGEPLGLIPACTGSVVTGGSLITATGEMLLDLQHAVAQEYRDNGSYITLDSTLGTLRKLRSGAGGTEGPWLLEPPSAPGQPTSMFGRPIFTDGNMAAQGSAAKTVAFGDISAYYVKDTGPFRFERSDEYSFNTDLVSFRGVLRSDSDLSDVLAVKVLRQSVT